MLFRSVVSNDADGVHWRTGVAAAYAPTPVKTLTGERVDVAPLYERLPCALAGASGAIVLVDDAAFSSADVGQIERQVALGRLRVIERPGGRVYVPTDGACG